MPRNRPKAPPCPRCDAPQPLDAEGRWRPHYRPLAPTETARRGQRRKACEGSAATFLPGGRQDSPAAGGPGYERPIVHVSQPQPAAQSLVYRPGGRPAPPAPLPPQRPPTPAQHALAELFLREMGSRAWTQRDVADRLGLRSGLTGGAGGVSRLIHGKANPQLTDLERTLRVVGMRVTFVPCCSYHGDGGDVDHGCEAGMTSGAVGVSG